MQSAQRNIGVMIWPLLQTFAELIPRPGNQHCSKIINQRCTNVSEEHTESVFGPYGGGRMFLRNASSNLRHVTTRKTTVDIFTVLRTHKSYYDWTFRFQNHVFIVSCLIHMSSPSWPPYVTSLTVPGDLRAIDLRSSWLYKTAHCSLR
jgi:hypothetical protein